ncbi:hypothetical protein D3C71_1738620 [compost metagenome]
MPGFEPALNRFDIRFAADAVAVNALFSAVDKSFLDRRRAFKIHIRYPQRQNILASEQLLGLVPFVGMRVGPVQNTVKIILQSSHLFF